MSEHLFKNWPIYILMALFIWVVVYAYINGRKEEKKKQEEKDSGRIPDSGDTSLNSFS